MTGSSKRWPDTRPAQVCSRAIIRFVHLFSQKASCWNITTRDAMALICIVVDFYV